MCHCCLKTLGLERYITLIFLCFSQKLKFSYWSERNISQKQQIFTKLWIIFTLFLSTAWRELKNLWKLIKSEEYVLCFLTRETSCVPSVVVKGSINPFPQSPNHIWGQVGNHFPVVLEWCSLAGLGNAFPNTEGLGVPLSGLNMPCLFIPRDSIHVFWRSRKLSFKAAWEKRLMVSVKLLEQIRTQPGSPRRVFWGWVEKLLATSIFREKAKSSLLKREMSTTGSD